jgi:FAD/FMN-containing dehydrogenase
MFCTGWTFSGGLSGTTAGRTFGFGVDQVLQLEMVLPNGQHVKVRTCRKYLYS